ncbi:transglutaminase-like domain-containing protein [Pseudomonas chlororaphis subsp. aurantiaca]|uniref:transglutaminase-like domain-containing protein n=1 Tax=Pseudomonas chlororaphis TaxID=587753 RepID=UPI0027DE8FA3|nr:transglutaminase-like domain-containing protein [Pseudomonas chlororaphis]WMI97578.1 transglutaminase-like domain-containing protein [Pseudomonas chlororaphis subsp. aurantiaca]
MLYRSQAHMMMYFGGFMAISFMDRARIYIHQVTGGNVPAKTARRIADNIKVARNCPDRIAMAVLKKHQKHPDFVLGSALMALNPRKVKALTEKLFDLRAGDSGGRGREIDFFHDAHIDGTHKLDKLEVAEEIFKRVRRIFKSSKFKSPNKVRMAGGLDAWDNMRIKLNTLREDNKFDTNNMLLLSAKYRVGACGEMAKIAYALCHENGLSPELVEYEDTVRNSFNHAACLVSIEGEDYVIDPWANLFCKRDEHKEKLIDKIRQWRAEGKVVTGHNPGVEGGILILTQKDGLKGFTYIISEADISNLVMMRSYKLAGYDGDVDSNIVNARFFAELQYLNMQDRLSVK